MICSAWYLSQWAVGQKASTVKPAIIAITKSPHVHPAPRCRQRTLGRWARLDLYDTFDDDERTFFYNLLQAAL